MIDVSTKFTTLRYAKAEGFILASPESLQKVKNREVPKGDVLEVARSAGIAAAKRTSEWLVFCHPVPLDWIDIRISVGQDHLRAVAEVRSIWRTGVEMEALTAVSAALLNIYDMLKPIDNTLRITEVQLLEKRGGKSDFTDTFKKPIRTAVLVISNSTYAGEREDKSGKLICEFLKDRLFKVEVYDVLPDDQQVISNSLIKLADDQKIDLIFTTGGTGFGPQDLTPEATKAVLDREAPGIAEAIRKHGKERTPYAMLSREVCGVRGRALIVNLPGSSKGAKESLEALFPGLLHIFPMLWGGGH